MADSHELRLMHVAAAADGCISAGIENFLFFRNAHFCRIRTCQMQLVWISLNLGMKNVSKLLIFDSKLNKKFLFDELLRWIEVIWLIEDIDSWNCKILFHFSHLIIVSFLLSRFRMTKTKFFTNLMSSNRNWRRRR